LYRRSPSMAEFVRGDTQDQKPGMQAFLERRRPVHRGQ
jgi:hypothetical protein